MTVEGPRRVAAPRWAVLSWVASLSTACGSTGQADMYITELMLTARDGWSWQA